MFEKATRDKLRFNSPKGMLSVEDLWDLPLSSNSTDRANLDDIAVSLYGQLQENTGTVSFVKPTAAAAKVNERQMKFELVKHIIDVRMAERDAAAEAAKRRETKARVLEIIATKQDEALRGKSLEELTALANSL